jgi:hypothetical protein
MFLKKASESDFFSEFENNLIKISSNSNERKTNRENIAIDFLKVAVNLLEQSNFKSSASKLITIIKCMEDSATSGLTSEKMLHNLEETGWVFNAPKDSNSVEDEEEIQVTLED